MTCSQQPLLISERSNAESVSKGNVEVYVPVRHAMLNVNNYKKML